MIVLRGQMLKSNGYAMHTRVCLPKMVAKTLEFNKWLHKPVNV